MKIALLSPGYPSETQPYNYAFVHARAKLYAAAGHRVSSFALGPTRGDCLDTIPVQTGRPDALLRAIRKSSPDVLALHSPTFRTMGVAEQLNSLPQVTWVHGHEALFSLRATAAAQSRKEKVKKLIRAIPRNIYQLLKIRDFLPTQHRVVFVSAWMKKEAERHTRRTYDNAELIPNPVDVDLFRPALNIRNKLKGVTARGLNSTKYGLDVAIRAFVGASAELTIVGTGPMERTLSQLIHRTGSRTALEPRYVPHRQMPELLARFGFFVAPSRVEAQGVAMCEAMACGLPVVATRVGGIPEFVTHQREGLLVPSDNPEALRQAVQDLVNDEDRFLTMSRAARSRMEKQCAPQVVIERELALLAATLR